MLVAYDRDKGRCGEKETKLKQDYTEKHRSRERERRRREEEGGKRYMPLAPANPLRWTSSGRAGARSCRRCSRWRPSNDCVCIVHATVSSQQSPRNSLLSPPLLSSPLLSPLSSLLSSPFLSSPLLSSPVLSSPALPCPLLSCVIANDLGVLRKDRTCWGRRGRMLQGEKAVDA